MPGAALGLGLAFVACGCFVSTATMGWQPGVVFADYDSEPRDD